MANGQTNGIPQGSVLMDFIAEMVLGYIDVELSNKIENENGNYKIIRYRDDYRIFVNNPEVGKGIVKELSYVLGEIGMRIKPEKTTYSSDVIRSSIKPDKLFWLTNEKTNPNARKQLLILLELSRKYPNSGALIMGLQKFYKKNKNKEMEENIDVLISIVVDIAFRNPKTYPIASAIISQFLDFKDIKQATDCIEKIIKKFEYLPNTEHLNLWLQRVALKINKTINLTGKLCAKVIDSGVDIWDSMWLNEDMRNIISSIDIIDREWIGKMEKIITEDEVSLFDQNYY